MGDRVLIAWGGSPGIERTDKEVHTAGLSYVYIHISQL